MNESLPAASVLKFIKEALPDNTLISHDAKEACVLAADVFLHYLTTCAIDIAKAQGRSTITSDNVIAALYELGFDDYVEPTKTYLDDIKSRRSQTQTAASKQ
ncbi:hypothetical protein WA158_005931 [Blastocystis sp. Blastoise]